MKVGGRIETKYLMEISIERVQTPFETHRRKNFASSWRLHSESEGTGHNRDKYDAWCTVQVWKSGDTCGVYNQRIQDFWQREKTA